MLPGSFPATAMPDPDWWNALWPDPAGVLVALGVASGIEAVDLCCGDGLFTVPLARVAAHVVAIDLDPEMLARTRARLTAAAITNCDVVEGDAYDIVQLVGWPADFVLIANTFHGVPDKERLARAVVQTLAPGGRFAVVNWHRRPREETPVVGAPRGPKTGMRMTPADVVRAIEPSGLRLAGTVELPPYHYGAIFEKLLP